MKFITQLLAPKNIDETPRLSREEIFEIINRIKLRIQYSGFNIRYLLISDFHKEEIEMLVKIAKEDADFYKLLSTLRSSNKKTLSKIIHEEYGDTPEALELINIVALILQDERWDNQDNVIEL